MHSKSLGVLLGLLLVASAHAELERPELVERDAVQRQLQQERERALRQQNENNPAVTVEGVPSLATLSAIPEAESPCFAIAHIELEGRDLARFQWAADDVAASVLPRCLGTQGINAVMARIQNAIIERGYVTTRVVAPDQDLRRGVLHLTVIPGRVHAIRFAPGTSERATLWNAMPIREGQLLNLRDIEQALENFKRVPTVTADIKIVPAEGVGVEPGDSDLVVQWEQATPFRISLGVDNTGVKPTGKIQGTATASYDNWWTLNDLFYASFNHNLTDGTTGGGTSGYTVHYSVPFDYWTAGWTLNRSSYYQDVAGAYQNYIYSGTTLSSELKLSRLIWRDASSKTVVHLKGWERDSKNYIDDTEIDVQRRRMVGWEAGLSHNQRLAEANLDLHLQYYRGTGAFDALPAPEQEFGEGTARMAVWRGDVQATIPFTVADQRVVYQAYWRGQANETPLLPQDRFSIGGPYTVRGFDGENSLMGESGWLIRNELSLPLAALGAECYLGLDYGQVSGPTTAYLVGTHLSGGGIGIRGSVRNLSYDVFVGKPISKPEGFVTASTTGTFILNWSY